MDSPMRTNEALTRAIEAIAPRFRSGNAVPVDKAMVPASEWGALMLALASAPAAVEPEQSRDALIRQALACIRWLAIGECRTAEWDGHPPKASDTIQALRAALETAPRPAEPVQPT